MAYAAAKGAIAALTRQLAVDYGRYGISLITVSPGWMRTPATGYRLEGEEDLWRLQQSSPLRLLTTGSASLLRDTHRHPCKSPACPRSDGGSWAGAMCGGAASRWWSWVLRPRKARLTAPTPGSWRSPKCASPSR
ncbi:SDR family oxidoreductase [Streptomyces luteogriseus]|uniref:SDR family oxidoreductase n=1 Tax=Streptomyces luteogriseus TaxID=68233 RepID=UPI003AF3EFAF